MSIFVCWVLLPLVLGVVALGCGLLVEVLSGFQLPGPLVPAIGLAVIIVVGDFATMSAPTARGHPAGRRSGRGRLWALRAPSGRAPGSSGPPHPPLGGHRIDRWAVLSAVAVYAVYAAPIVLSGGATFAGYITLDDTATWLALTDHVMQHGRSLAGLAPSTYQVVLKDYLSSGYPLGSFIPLGVGGALTGQDIAWLFQPTDRPICLIARAFDLFPVPRPGRLASPSRPGGVSQCTAGAALPVRVLERDQGDGRSHDAGARLRHLRLHRPALVNASRRAAVSARGGRAAGRAQRGRGVLARDSRRARGGRAPETLARRVRAGQTRVWSRFRPCSRSRPWCWRTRSCRRPGARSAG